MSAPVAVDAGGQVDPFPRVAAALEGRRLVRERRLPSQPSPPSSSWRHSGAGADGAIEGLCPACRFVSGGCWVCPTEMGRVGRVGVGGGPGYFSGCFGHDFSLNARAFWLVLHHNIHLSCSSVGPYMHACERFELPNECRPAPLAFTTGVAKRRCLSPASLGHPRRRRRRCRPVSALHLSTRRPCDSLSPRSFLAPVLPGSVPAPCVG